MHPNHKLSISLVAALVLWLPSLNAVLSGDLDIFGAAMRLALAVLGARVAIGGIAHLWSAYTPMDEADPDIPTTATPID